MSTQSLGQYLHGPKDLRLQSQPLSPPAEDEVQVAIRSTTLCGSDLHYYQHFRNGTILVREPLCLGHESAGEVIGLGSKAEQLNPTLSIGAKVALEVGVPCENCDLCSKDRYNICPNLRFRSSGSKFPHYQGTLQERLNHPARWVHKLPDDLDYDIGALLEPLAVAIHAVRRIQAPSQPDTWNCLIFGAGAVGLLCAAAARAEGCKNVVMADIDHGRLQFALKHGFASAIYLVAGKRPTSLEANKDVAREIEKVKLPDGSAIGKMDAVLECTGVESCLQASIYVGPSFPTDSFGRGNVNKNVRRPDLEGVSCSLVWGSLTILYRYPKPFRERLT